MKKQEVYDEKKDNLKTSGASRLDLMDEVVFWRNYKPYTLRELIKENQKLREDTESHRCKLSYSDEKYRDLLKKYDHCQRLLKTYNIELKKLIRTFKWK